MSDGGNFQDPSEKAVERKVVKMINDEIDILDRACEAKFISADAADFDVPSNETVGIALTRLKSLSGFFVDNMKEDLPSEDFAEVFKAVRGEEHTARAAGMIALCVATGLDDTISDDNVYAISNAADLGYDNRALLARAVNAENKAVELQHSNIDDFSVARLYGDAAINYDRILSQSNEDDAAYCVSAALGRAVSLAYGDHDKYPMSDMLREMLTKSIENQGDKQSFLTFERDEPKASGNDLG